MAYPKSAIARLSDLKDNNLKPFLKTAKDFVSLAVFLWDKKQMMTLDQDQLEDQRLD
jgi:hypothetical protein